MDQGVAARAGKEQLIPANYWGGYWERGNSLSIWGELGCFLLITNNSLGKGSCWRSFCWPNSPDTENGDGKGKLLEMLMLHHLTHLSSNSRKKMLKIENIRKNNDHNNGFKGRKHFFRLTI